MMLCSGTVTSGKVRMIPRARQGRRGPTPKERNTLWLGGQHDVQRYDCEFVKHLFTKCYQARINIIDPTTDSNNSMPLNIFESHHLDQNSKLLNLNCLLNQVLTAISLPQHDQHFTLNKITTEIDFHEL